MSTYDMTSLDYAYCNNCGKEAKSEKKVIDLFGTRRYRGSVYVQSHCRDCRHQEDRKRIKLGLVRHRN